MKSSEGTAADKAPTQQEARAKLRESFLRAISELSGEPCKILTYEETSLNAKFAGWNPDGNSILVENLETPALHKMPSALLRTLDVLAIEFKNQLK